MTLKQPCLQLNTETETVHWTDTPVLSWQPVQVVPTGKNLPVPLLQLIPVEGFSHLCDNFSADVRGKSVCLRRVCKVADPAAKQHI